MFVVFQLKQCLWYSNKNNVCGIPIKTMFVVFQLNPTVLRFPKCGLRYSHPFNGDIEKYVKILIYQITAKSFKCFYLRQFRRYKKDRLHFRKLTKRSVYIFNLLFVNNKLPEIEDDFQVVT